MTAGPCGTGTSWHRKNHMNSQLLSLSLSRPMALSKKFGLIERELFLDAPCRNESPNSLVVKPRRFSRPEETHATRCAASLVETRFFGSRPSASSRVRRSGRATGPGHMDVVEWVCNKGIQLNDSKASIHMDSPKASIKNGCQAST